jgi:hypothetical protein
MAGTDRSPDDELVAIVASVLPFSQLENVDRASRPRVAYFYPEQGHVLDLVYGKDRCPI